MPNRLLSESSPYLLQHSQNPVDWYPWGEEAFALARERDLPLLLSIGYASCHWCHVMARESFENPATAEVINRSFVAVKVDREERPDLDKLYQGVLQLMDRPGGWPLTIFLQPDGRPFYGGTYFPSEEQYGLPAFSSLLESLSAFWNHRRTEVRESADSFTRGLQALLQAGLEGDSLPGTRRAGSLGAKDLARVGRELARAIDPIRGGFIGAPKFPNPLSLSAMLRAHQAEPVLLTLEQMARGGIFDQLGGGFHRYSVDTDWNVPHFEKMLYDNALLARLYTEAWDQTHRPLFAEVVARTIDWLDRELGTSEGGFCSALDADSPGGTEGGFYLFSAPELEEALGPIRAKLAARHFGVTLGGTLGQGRSVLSLRSENALPRETSEALRRDLFLWRDRRPHPARDEKVLSGWNGLAIGALALAGRSFGRRDWLDRANKAAEFISDQRLVGDRLLRTARLPGILEDYGSVALGLIDLFRCSGEVRWLATAQRLIEGAIRHFWDPEAQAFRAAPLDGEPLVATVFSTVDEATPAGSSTLTEAMLRLAAQTGEVRFRGAAEAYLHRMRRPMLEQPFAYGQLLQALGTWLNEPSRTGWERAREDRDVPSP